MSTRSGFSRIAVIGTVLAATFAAGTPAFAQDYIQDGAANVGEVNITNNGTPTDSGEMALCDVDPDTPIPATATLASKSVIGVAKFGAGSTKCEKVGADNSITMNGSRFELSALRASGGPMIRVSTYKATCTSTGTGTKATFSLGGISGISVPSSLPQNYSQDVKNGQGQLLAKVFFNEPTVEYGAVRLNVMRVFFPDDSATNLRGSINVGSIECSPSF